MEAIAAMLTTSVHISVPGHQKSFGSNNSSLCSTAGTSEQSVKSAELERDVVDPSLQIQSAQNEAGGEFGICKMLI